MPETKAYASAFWDPKCPNEPVYGPLPCSTQQSQTENFSYHALNEETLPTGAGNAKFVHFRNVPTCNSSYAWNNPAHSTGLKASCSLGPISRPCTCHFAGEPQNTTELIAPSLNQLMNGVHSLSLRVDSLTLCQNETAKESGRTCMLLADLSVMVRALPKLLKPTPISSLSTTEEWKRSKALFDAAPECGPDMLRTPPQPCTGSMVPPGLEKVSKPSLKRQNAMSDFIIPSLPEINGGADTMDSL